MGSIILLDEHTINKIAAGEVVDRPSSIVKELVENAIDAKATNISVEIKKGGIDYICITDNGIGFAQDDIEMAFERHATSKIRKEEDLLKVTSMGFRGEALASIAAISKVTLTTKNINESIGTKTLVEAGKIISKEQVAYVTGSKIEVRDVFYNVPARFKFLKKDYTEAGYIEDVIIRIALANPNVSIKYVNNSKVVMKTSGKGSLKDTIYDIFGKEVYDNVIPIEYEMNSMKIEGMIGTPKISRSTRIQQFTFINSRYIKNKTITSAIDKACEEKYAINKHAFLSFNITISPSFIDVNVHPSKLEVKFEDDSKVFDLVYYGLKSAIEKKNKEESPFTKAISVENVEKIEQITSNLFNNGVIGSTNNVKKEFILNSNVSNFETTDALSIYKYQESEQQEDKEQVSITNEVINENENSVTVPNVDQVIMENNVTGYAKQQEMADIEKTPYKYIGQVFDTYIIIQIKDKMYIIDQHASHERLLYEKIKQTYYSTDKQSQVLLIPILLEFTSKEMDVILENIEMFEKSGFMLEEFGDKTIKISGVPDINYDIDYASMFKDVVDELLGATKTQKSEKEFRFLATLACKAAVKGNMNLNKEEQISLIDKMMLLERPFTCPHGRPTAYEISKYEIERRFLRK